MTRIDITIDEESAEEFKSLMNMIGSKALPHTKEAFNAGTYLVQKLWQSWTMGESVPGISDIKNPSAKLANTIRSSFLGEFTSYVGSNSPQMQGIVEGRKEYDMKNDAYLRGRKSRVSEKEKLPYLIIPFRWGTPNGNGNKRAHFGNAIPQQLYDAILAMKMKKSRRTDKTHFESNARGESVQRSEYEWGDRIRTEGNIDGLVRMENGTKSTYFTFRIISAKQIGTRKWIRPAVEGIDITKAIAENTKDKVAELMQEGLKADLE